LVRGENDDDETIRVKLIVALAWARLINTLSVGGWRN
jgi:hypothetical protein